MEHVCAENASSKSTSFFLQIVEHPDGTVTRPVSPLAPPSGEQSDAPVISKDVPLNPTNNTWLRIYRPNPLPPTRKLPVVIYFHGGGFVIFSAASAFYHNSCEAMTRAVCALVISLEYRLAPEHRLPAAYEDAVETVLWVQSQARDPTGGDPWVTGHGDFSRCFLMGSSAGANMAYHAGLLATALELLPLRLLGLILNQPYFGGVERTPSETRSEEDIILPLRANDMLWHLALPKGADRDHEFCNPAVAVPPELRHLPKCLVKGFEGDPLVDRQREFAKMLEREGASVVALFDEGGFHAVELFDPATAEALFAEVRQFISGGC
ncbi:hypothetical protein C4D60_Mb06t33180 [Musa balbisiana]|uniref:Alpha/beta hydrolase fold-3 domain-containing protein n=1 Tax=Musa balbisiana TaxID=52838 RepID=A0A4S8ISH8_MUSBA|nr:hypothetical protein C4D60_Mb06t33180 [Musa balbisiana]